MKSKFNKIFGVGLTIVLLASLLIVAPAAVSAGNLTYDVVKAPSAVGLVLTSATDVSFVAASADGKTVFAYDNAAKVLYKSADAGVTFTTTSIGTGLNTNTIVGLVVSPNYATDSIVAAATAGAYFSSSDGGKTFVNVANADLTVKLGSGTITSLDLAPYFATNILNAIVGVTGGTAANSNVLRFAYNSFEWVDVGTAASMTENVTAVKFSPNHLSDASILAVSTTTAPVTHVNIHTGLDTVAWNTPTLQFVIPGAFTATSAVIALGSDYLATGSSQTILVGTTDAAAASDVFRISQSFGQTTGLNATDLNLAGAATSSQIKDIAISGVTASTTLVATVGSAVVARTANPTGTVTWTTTNTKAATGAAASDVLWISGVAYVGTTGADSALSKSADGASWNQLSIIDVQLVSNNITLVGSAVVDANTIFVIINNANGVGVARSLFKTTNGGTSYERILTGATLATVNPSPAYATDSTVFVTDTTALIRKSTDGGTSFTSAAIPAAVTSFYVKDGSTFYAGTSGSFYKGGRFNAATGLQAATAITSIAISGTTILVGNADGDVYVSADDGLTFTRVGASDDLLGDGATVLVAFDPAFATNSTIYAGSSTATVGINRATATSTTATWTQIDDNGDTLVVKGLIADGSVLYAASNTAGKGIRRSLDPLTAVDATAGTAPTFASMNTSTSTVNVTTSMLQNLSIISATKTLYTIDSVVTNTSYGYAGRILAITDTLTGKATTTSPKQTLSAGVELIPALTTPTSATLVWAALTGATKYQVQYSTTATFTATTTTTVSDITTTSLAVTGLTSGVTYHWKVRATAPNLSLYSDVAKFYTALPAPAAPPVVYFPALGATAISITPTLTWPTIVGATSYDFAIGEDPTFKIIDFADTVALPAVSIPATEPLKYNTTYYWRIRGTTSAVVGAGGGTAQAGAYQIMSFTTMAEPVEVAPPAPEQVIIKEPGESTITTIEIPRVETVVVPQAIPSYLLWAIIGIGAILVIALIVLIVRTRRVA